MASDDIGNSWEKYQKLVLSSLDRHNDLLEKLRDEIIGLRSDMIALKVKVALVGIGTGTVGGGSMVYLIKFIGGE
ncbi:hypothetical protein CMI37_37510 [Candidatus Pacearchaeota archaeon]|nr:hypothetical protein [Candidatus Pacearchaeota archaeon]|tara:strand:+ start:6035 stop:6259 length:225 start_codon:yes stop_codon:yes gene_type:complete